MVRRELCLNDEQVVPVIDYNIPGDASAALVSLGYGMRPLDDTLFQAYGQLRYNVYNRQQGFLPEGPGTTEFDEDDERSQHFLVIQRVAEEVGKTAAVACMRVIHRGDKKLPIELLFPDSFKNHELPRSAAEISRYISRSERSARPGIVSRLFTTALAHTEYNELNPVVAVLEKIPQRQIAISGAPSEVITEEKPISEYGGTINRGVRIRTEDMVKGIPEETLKGFHLDLSEVLFWSEGSSA